MKRVIATLLLGLVITGLAILPGFDKKIVGFYLESYLSYSGGGVYYMEGINLLSIDELKINFDGFLGAGIGVGYFPAYYGGYLALSPAIMGSILVYKEDLNFELAGYTIMPAVEVDTGVEFSYFSYVGLGDYYDYFSPSYIYPYPYIMLMFKKPDWGDWLSIYLWPAPLILGVNFISL